MAPTSAGSVGDEASRDVDEIGQWEDYTCQGQFEDLVRSFETVLREWRISDRDHALSNEAVAAAAEGIVSSLTESSGPSTSPPAVSYSRCLEHDGQLFSIQLVPPPDQLTVTAAAEAPPTTTVATPPTTTATTAETPPTTTATPNRTASAACQLEDRRLDFAVGGGETTNTPLHRWFGLKQYVLVRALGQGGSPGMGVDHLLWATTVAAGNCKCSVPVLVSCDWDGLVDDDSSGGVVVQSGASCKGYSTPGSKGVACSVRFQTAWTGKPSRECLFLDGLTDLFLSKIRDAHCLPGRAFAPIVSTTVQQSWEWTKPEEEAAQLPAPALPWEGGGDTGGGGGGESVSETAVVEETDGRRWGTSLGASTVGGDPQGPTTPAAEAAAAGESGGVRARENAVRQLLRAVGGGRGQEIRTPVWGPDEDPLVSIFVRVRWTDLREGLVEESQHYTTLEPLPEEARAGAGGADGGYSGAGVGGHWFVSPRWKQQGQPTTDATSSSSDNDGDRGSTQRQQQQQQHGGRLGDACSRLLAALVLTTAMHPGTLMADLGAGSVGDGRTALAQDYGKAASAMLSDETRKAVEEMCRRSKSPSINHDDIDLILRYLLHSQGEERAVATAANQGCGGFDADGDDKARRVQPSLQSSRWRQVHLGTRQEDPRQSTEKWKQVYPRARGVTDDSSKRQLQPEGGAAEPASVPNDPSHRDVHGTMETSWAELSTSGSGGASSDETMMGGREGRRSLWAWAERGGAPIGRLLSLLSLRVASCDDLGSMSLLWMSFVRDVRLLWEDGSNIARMSPITAVDGTSMYDRSASCTGQDRSVASQLRGSRQADGGSADGSDDGSGGDGSLPPWSDRSLVLYPDTRTCLIWQKLQMLNCCRAEGAAQVDLQPSPPPSQDVGDGTAGQGEGEKGPGDDEDEEAFFDTREYYQTSEDEGSSGDIGGGVQDDQCSAGDVGRGGECSAEDDDVLAAADSGVGEVGTGGGVEDEHGGDRDADDNAGGVRAEPGAGEDDEGALSAATSGDGNSAAESDAVGDHAGGLSGCTEDLPEDVSEYHRQQQQRGEGSSAQVLDDETAGITPASTAAATAVDLSKIGEGREELGVTGGAVAIVEGGDDRSSSSSSSSSSRSSSGSSRSRGGVDGEEIISPGDTATETAPSPIAPPLSAGTEEVAAVPALAPAAAAQLGEGEPASPTLSSPVPSLGDDANEALPCVVATETTMIGPEEEDLATAVAATSDEALSVDEGGDNSTTQNMLKAEREEEEKEVGGTEEEELQQKSDSPSEEEEEGQEEEEMPQRADSPSEEEPSSPPSSPPPIETGARADEVPRNGDRDDGSDSFASKDTPPSSSPAHPEEETPVTTEASSAAAGEAISDRSTCTPSKASTMAAGEVISEISTCTSPKESSTAAERLTSDNSTCTSPKASSAAAGEVAISEALPEKRTAIIAMENSPDASDKALGCPEVATTAATGSAAAAVGDEPLVPPMRRLLCSGAAVRPPRLQESGPVTEDMLRQQTLGQAAAYRGREVLLADMTAFRAENDGGDGGAAVFADFVRWYRPECWQETTADGEWVSASEGRLGGRAEDDKRLAWPGQGQVVWKPSVTGRRGQGQCRDEAPEAAAADELSSGDHSGLPPALPSPFTLAGWLSCWGQAGAAVQAEEEEEEGEERALPPPPLFSGVTEGEKALHFLETISPGPLLVQLLSALLGLSVFILEEACLGAGSLPSVEVSVDTASRKVAEAVELLSSASTTATHDDAEGNSATATNSSSSSTNSSSNTTINTTSVEGRGDSGCSGGAGSGGGDSGSSSISSSSSSSNGGGGISASLDTAAEVSRENSRDRSSLSPFRSALLAADGACVAVKRAETALSRAVSLQRSLPGKKDLVNDMVAACGDEEKGGGEVLVSARPHKEFLRDLLLAQGIQKTPGSELDELLASYDEEHRREELKDESGAVGGGGVMPPPHTKEYVLRCQTPAPFYSRNVGRGQMEAYPTPPSRMYAKTDGSNLRVALSLCESDI